MKHLYMNHFSRRHVVRLGTLSIIFAAGALPLLQPPALSAQLGNVLQDSPAYLIHGSQGYLGVNIQDVDNDRAIALKLKDTKGAEVVTVDHDAPAGKAGLQVHDVIVQMNGQTIEGAEQLRRMLHETPPGRAVTFVVSRDGQQMNLNAQLVDRRDLDREIWGKHVNQREPEQEAPSSAFLGEKTPGIRGFVDAWPMGSSSSFSVGAAVKPLTAQLANYFGATEGMGLLVESVDGKSAAAAAGLKAGDIVLKINDETMATRADWQRVLRANEGKQVQVTVLREKKQQQLSMQAGNSKKKGALQMPDMPSAEQQQLVAELGDAGDLSELFRSMDTDALAAEAQKAIGDMDLDAIRAQAEQASRSADMNAVDMDALRQQLQQAMKDVDTDAMRQQLQAAQEAAKNIDVDAARAQAEQAARQMETLKKQLEEMKKHLNQSLPE